MAENHPYFQQLVKDLLGPPFEIVGKVEDERVLLEGAATLKPDVVLTGIDMPILNGLKVLRQVHLGTLPSIELLPT
jgi:DNA-binding NarL/FixJ family response regulator